MFAFSDESLLRFTLEAPVIDQVLFVAGTLYEVGHEGMRAA